MGISLMDEKLG